MSEMIQVPDGWEEVCISEIADVFGGGTPDRSNSDFWENGTIFWATPTDITAIYNSNYIEDTKEKISEKGLSGSSAKLLPIGSILLTSRATIGERKISKIPICTNQGFTSLVPKGDNGIFIYYLLDKYLVYMYSRAYGTTFPEISRTEVKNIKVVLPKEKKEQEKIAKILSTLDKSIEATNRLIEKEKNIKKALMQELLTNGIDKDGHIRSPQTYTYKESELGLIPNEWEVVSLKEITKVQQGLQIAITDRKEAISKNSYPYITIQYLKNNKVVEYIEDPKKSVLCSNEDILMTRTGNTGIVVTNVCGVFHNNFFRVDFDRKKIDKTFFVYFLESSKVQLEIELKAGVTTIPDLNHGDFYFIKFMMMNIEEQKQIAKILTTQDKKIETEETNLAKLKELKKGLMNDLLSGKVRVKV